eukprot:3017093-Rhodomonas_salina.2
MCRIAVLLVVVLSGPFRYRLRHVTPIWPKPRPAFALHLSLQCHLSPTSSHRVLTTDDNVTDNVGRDGVINGFAELQDRKGLKHVINASQIRGLWTWSVNSYAVTCLIFYARTDTGLL